MALATSAFAAREARRFVLADSRFVMPGSATDNEETTGLVVRGLAYASRARVVRVFEDDFGRNVFQIPIGERRRRLLAVDWVEDASVARIWPNRIEVRIRERKPVAFLNLPHDPAHPRTSRPAMIDVEGVILEQPAKARFSFPIAGGIAAQQTERERREKVRLMLRVMRDLGEVAKEVTEIDVSSTEVSIAIGIEGREVELLVGDRNYFQRTRNFLDHYPEIRRRSSAVTSFDLRMDDRITARE